MTEDDFVPTDRSALCGLYLGASERAAVWSDEATLTSRQRWSCVYRDQRAHNHRDFLRFLRALEVFSPAGTHMHVLMNNFTSHTRYDVDLWLSKPRRERFRLYATPELATWIRLAQASSREVKLARAAGQWVFRPTDDRDANEPTNRQPHD
jgi:hypothetical protein